MPGHRLIDQVGAIQTRRGPDRVSPDHVAVILKRTAKRRGGAGVGAATYVREGNQRVAAEVRRITFGDVPPREARKQVVVACLEHRDEIDPRFGVGRPRRGGLAAGDETVRRADLLALVATVDAAREGLSVLPREDPRGLDEPRKTTPSVENSRSDESTGRARRQAALA